MRSVPGELMSRTRFRTVSRVFYFERFFFGRLFRLVLAKSLSCFSLIDLAICLEATTSIFHRVWLQMQHRRPSAVFWILRAYF